MKVLVFELNSFHIELLPMYQPLMPSLFGRPRGAYGLPLILQREVAALWGVPENACVTYSGLEDLADQLIRGLGDQAEQAQRYQLLISGKVQENQRVLKELSRDHPAFAHTRQ